MGTPADTLVEKYPTREAQLKKPVLDYLKTFAPYNGTEQDLYLAVFYPAYRKVNPTVPFSAAVQKQNPGIHTPQDYVDFVNRNRSKPELTPAEWTALKDTANALGLKTWEPLYKLINFESGWNPKAKNPISGARGLIQFMPSTALWMGFKSSVPLAILFIGVGIAYYFAKRYGVV